MKLSLKSRQGILFYFLLFIFIAHPAQGESPVWEVKKNGNRIFIGGTFHLLTPTDYPLPTAFEKAYNQSTQVIFETDIEKLQAPEFQQSMLRKLSYSDGRDLQQVLSEETYLAVEEFFGVRGIPMSSMVNYKPGMVAMLMTIIELQRLGLVGVGVDNYFSKRTVTDQKKRGQLESVEEQLKFISTMGEGQENEMLTYNLADMARLPSMWQSLKEAWRSGDMSKLEEVAVIPLENDFPKLYQSILVGRNEAWLPLIEALLETAEVEFVLVGALHLAGGEGVLAKLSAQGYKIHQLP